MGAVQIRLMVALIVIGCFIALARSSLASGEVDDGKPVPPPGHRGTHSDSHQGSNSYSYSYRQKRCVIPFICGGSDGAPGAPGGSGSGEGAPGAPGKN